MESLTSDVYLINEWSNYTWGNLQLTWQLTNVELVRDESTGKQEKDQGEEESHRRRDSCFVRQEILSAAGGADENLLK